MAFHCYSKSHNHPPGGVGLGVMTRGVLLGHGVVFVFEAGQEGFHQQTFPPLPHTLLSFSVAQLPPPERDPSVQILIGLGSFLEQIYLASVVASRSYSSHTSTKNTYIRYSGSWENCAQPLVREIICHKDLIFFAALASWAAAAWQLQLAGVKKLDLLDSLDCTMSS